MVLGSRDKALKVKYFSFLLISSQKLLLLKGTSNDHQAFVFLL